ncbi:MAG: hypothetical protein QW568_02765 [Candidatus Anstonellaceae archaeon]
MEEEQGDYAANQEIRFIALELMKLAQKSGKSFDEVAREYMDNTIKLQMLISGEEQPQAQKKAEVSRQK